MPALEFGTSAFSRARGALPALPVINMFAEAAPTEGRVLLQSRAGLVDRSASMGTGPVEALFRLDGVLSGTLFGVSAGNFFSGTTDRGAMVGSGPYFMDAYTDQVFVSTGSLLYGWNGTTLAAITTPAVAVGKVVVGGGRLIVIDTDSDRFWWSQPLLTTVGGLNFASAESRPDKARDIVFLDDVLTVFGAKTVEFWPNTSDDDLPFVPLEARVFERGVRALGCATAFNATIAWVTDINQVCVTDPSGVVSTPGMEAEIAASSVCRLWTCNHEGTEFLILTLDAKTYAYSARSQTWSEFQSYGKTNWWARCFSDGVFGSAYDGKTLAFGSTFEELGGRLERRFRAGLRLDGGAVPIDRVTLRTNPGQTTYLSGAYADPSCEMRLSRNGGQTWTAYRTAAMGAQAEYSARVQWHSCGVHTAPGMMAEFRCTDPVDWRVSGVFANEPYGGL